jgi:hypothetical protein
MITQKNLIYKMKRNSFEDAMCISLPIFDRNNKKIGKLIPVGKWILSKKNKIENLTSWREQNMKFFFSQFKSNYERTVWYIKSLSIEKENRIFFLIYTNNNEMIGHIGLADIESNFGVLDNMIRGKETGDAKLINYSMITIINWFFKEFNIKNLYGKIISYNWLTISLHEEIGFKIIEKIPLKKIQENGEIYHKNVNSSESNVRYFCTKMLLEKIEFYKHINWIDA